ITVNQELKGNVEELSRANSDLQNLMAATDIGTIFLDRHLSVKRFTPRVQDVFNLIPADVGRPLSDITHRLKYDELAEDAAKVLRDLGTIECEVQNNAGAWFLARIGPYRTLEDKIDGVVMTFVDITRRKLSEEKLSWQAALRASDERFRLLMEGARDYAMFLLEPDNVISYWSAGAQRVFGWSAEEAIGQSGELIFTSEDRAAGRVEKEMTVALQRGSASDSRWHLRKDGSRIGVDGVMRRLDGEG